MTAGLQRTLSTGHMVATLAVNVLKKKRKMTKHVQADPHYILYL